MTYAPFVTAAELPTTTESPIPVENEHAAAQRWRAPLRVIGGLALGGAVLAGPAIAMEVGPMVHPGEVHIAGQKVTYEPKIGWDHTQIGAGIRQEHKSILGINFGADVHVNWKNINFADKNNRNAFSTIRDDPKPEVAAIKNAVEKYTALLALSGLAGALTLEGGIFITRRVWRNYLSTFESTTPQQEHFHKSFRRLGLGVSALTLAGMNVAGGAILLNHDNHTVVPNHTLERYGIADTELTGLANEAVPYLQLLLPENNFGDRVEKNLQALITSRPDLAKLDDEVSLVVVDDLQGNAPMARATSLTAKELNSDAIVNTGDLSGGGTPVESIIFDPIIYYADGVPIYLTPGKHDNLTFEGYAKERGLTVGDGKTIDVAGLPLQFVPDPLLSAAVVNFGGGDVLRNPDVSADEAITKAVNESCESQPVITFTHDHYQGQRIAQEGCSPYVIDGRSYTFVGPQTVSGANGYVTEYTSGSGGGYRDTKANFGQLQNPATFSVIKYNKLTHNMYYSVFTVNPDATVEATPLISMDVSYDQFLKTGRTEPEHINNFRNKPTQPLAAGNNTAAKH
jgi:hypothetical protein